MKMNITKETVAATKNTILTLIPENSKEELTKQEIIKKKL